LAHYSSKKRRNGDRRGHNRETTPDDCIGLIRFYPFAFYLFDHHYAFLWTGPEEKTRKTTVVGQQNDTPAQPGLKPHLVDVV